MSLHSMTASALSEALDRGETSSVEIVKALHARADRIEPSVGGFTIQLREQALREAHQADAERARGEVRRPLHGLPLTIKDNIDIAGLPSTLGLARRAHHRADRDAVIVQQARRAGAIVLGKSNVPQALIPMDCDNRVFGRSHNPWSDAHITGGSSGGEAALIASGASVMGLGSDLGGSIRFPAAFCGIFGLKPTTDRWSNRGLSSPLTGQELIRAQVGPMARSAHDLALLLRALPSTEQTRFDARVPPAPLGDPAAIDMSSLRIGWYLDDGFITPAPAMQRAVREAADALADRGATLIEQPPPDQQRVVETYLGATSSDGMHTLRGAFDGEAPIGALRTMWAAGQLPRRARGLIGRVLRHMGEKRLASIVAATGKRDVASLWALTAQRQRLRIAELDRWNATQLDLILAPASASPAVPFGLDHDFSIIFSYFGRYNLYGFPAGVIPFTRVRPSETRLSQRADGRADRIDRRAAQVAAQSRGLPVAVQLIGRPWREDVVLAAMLALEQHARARSDYPRTPIDPFA